MNTYVPFCFFVHIYMHRCVHAFVHLIMLNFLMHLNIRVYA